MKLGLLIAAACLAVGVVYEAIRGIGNAATPASAGSDFTAADLHNKDWTLAAHRGKGPLILSFFATWCGPCAMERPELYQLQRKYADRGLQVVLLTKESADVVRAFPELASGPLTILTDAEPVFQLYGVNPIPHTVFFDERGQIVEDIEGYSPEVLAKVERRLESMPPLR